MRKLGKSNDKADTPGQYVSSLSGNIVIIEKHICKPNYNTREKSDASVSTELQEDAAWKST